MRPICFVLKKALAHQISFAVPSRSYDSKFLFGHQNTNYIGQYFLDKDGTSGYSDVKNGTGSYPAVFGFDFADVVSWTDHLAHATPHHPTSTQ